MKKLSLKPRKSFIYMIIVVIGVVMVWRGIWNLLDMYVFPNQPILSNLISIGVGLFLLYLPDKDINELV